MDKKINEILMDIRKSNKLSRPALEKISGFNHLTIGAYERGTRKPSKEYIEFISLYFGYKKEYIEGENIEDYKIDHNIRVLLMYQSIYNYDDKKMAELLKMKLEEYRKIISQNYLNDTDIKSIFVLSMALNIKLYSFVFSGGTDSVMEIINLSKDSEQVQVMISYNEENGIEITPEYYASVIKKRNQPKEEYTPNDDLKEIPPKHKEILKLLPFAPDSFIDTIIEKLKTIKETQQL